MRTRISTHVWPEPEPEPGFDPPERNEDEITVLLPPGVKPCDGCDD